MAHASRNGKRYLRDSRESLTCPDTVRNRAWLANVTFSISFNSSSACSGVRERSSAMYARDLSPRLNNQRGDSERNALPITNKTPGGSENQKIRRQAWFLNEKTVAAWAFVATAATR